MKLRVFSDIFVAFAILMAASTSTSAQQTITESLNILDEKLSRLRADVEDLQFKQQQMQKDIAKIQEDLLALRRASVGGSAGDLEALQARVDALDAARQKDKQAIIDHLAKELAALNLPRAAGKTGGATTDGSPTTTGKEHVVAKGESLTTIAKTYGVSVEDLKKANNISNPNEIKVGQKLIIPK
jgi:LysM repeat protein